MDKKQALYLMIIWIDCLTAWLLGRIGQRWSIIYNARCNRVLEDYNLGVEKKTEEKSEEKSKEQEIQHVVFTDSFFVNLYQYNPLAILGCLSLSSQIIYNCLIALFLNSITEILYNINQNDDDPIKRSKAKKTILINIFIGSTTFAMIAVGQFYIMQLLFPIIFLSIFLSDNDTSPSCEIPKKDQQEALHNQRIRHNLRIFSVAAIICSLAYKNLNDNLYPGSVQKSWDFVRFAPDYTPNTGIWWYLIIEMFEHFRDLFLQVLQVNVFFYALPLSIYFMAPTRTKSSKTYQKDDSILVMLLLTGITAIFKSYSTLLDLMIPLTLIFAFNKNSPHRKANFVAATALFICICLCPFMWQQWVILGRGNSNFFFAVTLGIVACFSLILGDVVYGHVMMVYRFASGNKEGKLAFGNM